MDKISPYWKEQVEKIKTDLEAKDFWNFQNWEAIRSNMVVQWDSATECELMDLSLHTSPKVLETPPNGNPVCEKRNGKLISANTIHLLYHWMTWGNLKGMDCIVEFGGGYGEMYRLARSLGFEGEYIMFDLPVLNVIQIAFTGQLFLNDKCGCVSEFKELPSKADLIVSMSSITEMPMEYRDELLSKVETKGLLLSYSDSSEYNNSQWCRDVASRYPDMKFTFRDHPYRKLKYMIGRNDAGIPVSGSERPRAKRGSFSGGRS